MSHNRLFHQLSQVDTTQIKMYTPLSTQGRNASEVRKMIAHIRQFNTTVTSPITILVEVEKRKPELAEILGLPDVLLMSKEYAGYHGYNSPEQACQEMRKKALDRYRMTIIHCTVGGPTPLFAIIVLRTQVTVNQKRHTSCIPWTIQLLP